MIYRADTKSMDNHSDIRKGDNAKSKKGRVVILVCASRLVLLYISTKHHKNISRVFDLQSRHKISGLSLSTKGDNTKSKKGRVVSLVRDTSSGPVLHFCHVPWKYSTGYSSYRADTKSFSNKTKGDIPKVRKAEVSFLYASSRLVLFYISIKNHQNIPKGIQVTERTRSFMP